MAVFVIDFDVQGTKDVQQASSAIGSLQSGMGDLKGGTAQFSDGMGDMEEAAAGGEAAFAAAAVAVAALAAAALAAGAALAVSAGETRQAFLAMATAETGSAQAGKQVVDLIDSLALKLPVAKEKLEAYAKSFLSAGIRSVPALTKALEATAAASALMGDEAGAQFANLISKANLLGEAGKNFKNFAKSLQDVGLDVNDVAKELGVPAKQLEALLKSGKITSAQLGDALQDAMIKKGANAVDVANQRLSAMWDKAKVLLVGMFDGIVDTPGYKEFLHALEQIGYLLGANAETGKSVLTSLFSTVFSLAAKVITFTTIGLLKIATYGIKAYIWLFPFLKKLKEWWAGHAMTEKFVMTLKVIGAVIGGVIVAAVAALVGAWLALNAAIYVVVEAGMALWKVILAVGSAIYKAVSAIWDFIKGAGKALEGWVDSASDFAARFIAGLVGGLASGSKAVGDAAAKVGDAAKQAIASQLGIHSPSTVAYDFGGNVGQGFALGMTDSANDVGGAASQMGGQVAASVSGASSGGGGRSLTINVMPGAVQINGAKGDATELTREALESLLEEALHAAGYGKVA